MASEEERTQTASEAPREDSHEDHDEREPGRIEEPRAGTSSHHSDDNFVTAFQLLKAYFDKRFCSLRRDLVEDAKSNSHYVDKRAKQDKRDKKVDLKFKGNKKQYDFISDILERVKVAIDVIEKRKESKALKTLDKVVEALNGRNKLIRMADKSQAGWDIVEEYLTDELASDSDDEKKIRQAEARALKKKKTKVETYKQSKKYLSTRSGTVDTSYRPLDSSVNSQQRNFRPFKQSQFRVQRQALSGPTDTCFACGQQGHWRKFCPAVNWNFGFNSRQQQIKGQ